MQVHRTALISDGATIAKDVHIGPYCVVGPDVVLGPGCRLHSHVVLEGKTEIGENCEIFPFATIGAPAQDKALGPNSRLGRLVIGSHNRFREYVTIHPGTPKDRGITTVGDHNMLLIGAHIGHDAVIGSNIVMTNSSMAAGHTVVEDRAILGAMVGIHQYCRVGTLAMLAGGAMASRDTPPFAMVQGDRAIVRGVNTIGMRRADISTEDIAIVKHAFRILFWRGHLMPDRIEAVRRAHGDHPLVTEIVRFLEGSRRGVQMARGRLEHDENREQAHAQ